MTTNKAPKFTTVDEYVAYQNPVYNKKLTQFRNAIKKAAPEAEEIISYQMPAYKYQGILVYLLFVKVILVFIQFQKPLKFLLNN